LKGLGPFRVHGSKIQGSKVQRFKGSEVQRFRGSRFKGLKAINYVESKLLLSLDLMSDECAA